MRRGITAMLPLAALLIGGCTAETGPDAEPDRRHPAGAVSPPAVAASPPATAREQRLEERGAGARPDCRDGGVTRVIPGHAGWEALKDARSGLLRHSEADHAAWSPSSKGRPTLVLYRSDETIKASARLYRWDGRWFADSIAVCRSTIGQREAQRPEGVTAR
jgi:hypothetical protein